MSSSISYAGMVVAAASALVSSAAPGQDYPVKPVRIITSGVGGGTDFTSRLIAQGLSVNMGQQVLVDNRASSVITGEFVSRAAPDGYTLLTAANSLWQGPLLQKVGYDAIRDFAPITLAVTSPNILVVHPSLPVKTVKELIALAKARPGELNFGSGGNGSSSHLSAELFRSMAGINMVRINYKGTGPVYAALIGGEIQVFFSTPGGATPHIKSGRLRPIAVTSLQPSALYPDMPTVASAGLAGYESSVPHGVVAPAKTPAAIIAKLHQEIVRVLNAPESRERFLNSGVEVVGSTPDQFSAYIRNDVARLTKVIKEAGIRAE